MRKNRMTAVTRLYHYITNISQLENQIEHFQKSDRFSDQDVERVEERLSWLKKVVSRYQKMFK